MAPDKTLRQNSHHSGQQWREWCHSLVWSLTTFVEYQFAETTEQRGHAIVLLCPLFRHFSLFTLQLSLQFRQFESSWFLAFLVCHGVNPVLLSEQSH